MKTHILRRRKSDSLGVTKVITYFFLSLWALTTIYPFVWVILNSFKSNKLIRSESFSIPMGNAFTMENYAKALTRVNIGTAYRNSLVISGCVTVLVILIAGLFAYALARYQFKGRQLFYTAVLAAMMFPAFSTIIPVFRMEHAWGLTETSNIFLRWLSVILPQTAANLSFAIIVLTGYLRSIPLDLEEAAYLEGYSVFRIYFCIVMPLARPSFATVGIFSFLWSYNDLFTQMFFLRSREYFTVTRLLNEISSQSGTDYGLMCAAVALVVFPVLIVYILLQKNIVKGLTAGAIKG